MNINELFTDGLNFAVSFLRLFTNFTRTMNVQLISADDVHQICRSCLCKGDKLIPLDVPYNHVVNTKYDCVNAAETIGELLMACGNIHITADDGLPQSVCIKCFMSIRATFVYRQMCDRSDAVLREIFQQRLSVAPVKLEKTYEDQEGDPLLGTCFDETKLQQLEYLPDFDENHPPAETHEIPDENIPEPKGTRPKKGKNGDRAKKKTNLTEKEPIDQSDEKDSHDGARSVVTYTSNGTGEVDDSRRQYICEICARSFHDRAIFRRHARVHSNERNFVCDICKRRFKARGNLSEHLKIHIDKALIQTHLCSVCGAGFKNASLLITHTRRHTGERPFKCDRCDKAFHAMRQLSRHRGIHDVVKAFICSICSKEFSRKDKYKLHMMVHNDIRPYKCDLCDRGFTQPVLLKKHMLSHEGQKAHVCNICNAGFTKSIQLINHRTLAGHVETPS